MPNPININEEKKEAEKKEAEKKREKAKTFAVFQDAFSQFQELSDESFLTEQEKQVRNVLSENLTGLLKQMDVQYRRRNRLGNYVPMTQEDYQNLLTLFENCLQNSRQLSNAYPNNETIQNLRLTLAKGRNSLASLQTDKLPSFAEAVSNLAPSVIHLINKGGQAVGGAMSSRVPITYADELGRIQTGFLTRDDKIVPEKQEALDEFVQNFIKDYHESEVEQAVKAALNDEDYLKNFEYRDYREKAKAYYLEKQPDWLQGIKEGQREAVYVKLTKELWRVLNRVGILKQAGIRPGGRIARRNGAMSDVARKLGFPNLLAESRRVTLEEDGKTIDGVVMNLTDPDTVDVWDNGEDSPIFRVRDEEFENPKVLKALADLQIIDFLCANTDRHFANFFPRFDTSDPYDPKIVGVQGIDNDNSFGTITKGRMRLANADKLKIITPQMADAVERMTKEDLDEILSDYGLSKEEKDAAAMRLQILKSHIENGKNQGNRSLVGEEGKEKIEVAPGSIHIVQDGELEVLSLNVLESEGSDGENIFHQMKEQLKYKQKKVQQRQYGPKETYNFENQDVVETVTKMRESLQEEYLALKKLQTKIEERCELGKDEKTTFRNVKTSVDFLVDEYKKVLTQTRNVWNLDEASIDTTMDTLKKFYNRLSNNRADQLKTANDYKDSHFFIRGSSKGRARKNVAQSLGKITARKSPASKDYFDRLSTHKKAISEAFAKKEDETVRASNQLGGLMESTLRRNVEKHSRSGQTYAFGVKALQAQKNLWNYSQSQTVENETSEKTADSAMNEESIDKISYQELEQQEENRPNRKDVTEDVKAILRFVEKQKTSAARNLMQQITHREANGKTFQMTPMEALRFLGAVFETEYAMENGGKKKTGASVKKGK